MDDRELEVLLQDTESDRSERTASQNNTDKFGEAMCAFANDLPRHGKPGYLFVGVNDNGTPSADAISDQLLIKLSNIRDSGNLLPPPVVNVSKRVLFGSAVAVVEVFPSDLPPVQYKGTVWVRVGPRKARATQADERALSERRSASARTWDARACSGATLSDLVLSLFDSYRIAAVAKEVIDENHRSLEDQLSSLRLWERSKGCPTNASVLLFGKDALSFAPGAYVQYVHYEGTTSGGEVKRERRMSGDLLTILRELQNLVDELANGRPVEADSMKETIVYDYPPRALRETFANAIVHRDYESNTPTMILHFDDRIEVHNPGGLFGDMSRADFPGVMAYRNPILAEAAKIYGYVNRYGRGVPSTVEAMERNGSAPPRFEPKDRHFLVSLERRS